MFAVFFNPEEINPLEQTKNKISIIIIIKFLKKYIKHFNKNIYF